MNFDILLSFDEIKLYAGDIVQRKDHDYAQFIGLSLTQDNDNHIKFDITKKFPIPDNYITIFQAEDVFEHILYEKLLTIINEIYRILKTKGLFRLSVPDYNCDILYKRALYNHEGNIVFDPGGGGTLNNPGHVWFPTYEKLKKLLKQSLFYSNGSISYLHYYINRESFVTNEIDYEKGFVIRTPDHDVRVNNPYRPMSIVVDCIKE